MIILQLILFCALFTLMVKIAVGNNALNGLYFYPKPIQERAFEIGLTDRETVARKRKRFMIPFFLVMLAALVLIIGLWNRVKNFWPAVFLTRRIFAERRGGDQHIGIINVRKRACTVTGRIDFSTASQKIFR